MQIGSSVGSFLGQKFGVSATWLRVLVACGAAGGISATFNAPIAGVFFALEVILQTFSVQYFGVVVISSVTASVVAQAVLGDFPAFEIPLYNLNSFWELALFTVLGVLAALVGLGFMRILYFMEDRFDSVRWFPEYCKPVVGGLAVGLIGVFYPQVFGVGYDAVTGALTDALNGGFTLQLLVALALMKILATSLTLGSGGSGGVFAPSLFIGAMAGTAYGKAAQLLFPGIVVSPGAYGLVGMAAVFAGAAWAPITSIIIVFEMTRDYNIILPLMLAVVVSTFISRRLSKDSIYTLKLRRRGIDLMSPSRRAGIDTILAGEIMLTAYPHIQADEFVQDIAAKFEETGMHGFPILSDGGELVGIVTTTDVEHAMANGFQGREALDIATRSLITAFTDQTISDVLSQPGAQEVGYIPVVDRIQPRTLLGVLRREDIIRAYVTAVSNGTEEDSLE